MSGIRLCTAPVRILAEITTFSRFSLTYPTFLSFPPFFLPFPTHLHFSFIPISLDRVHRSGNCRNRELPKVSRLWDVRLRGLAGANVCLHRRPATSAPSISRNLLGPSVEYPRVGYRWKATDEESPILTAEAYNSAIRERWDGL